MHRFFIPAILFVAGYATTATIQRDTAPPAHEDAWTDYIVANTPGWEDSRTQVTLWDRTRPDILRPAMAIEVDWCHKWKEGVGQAAFYGAMCDRPGVLVLLFPDGVAAPAAMRDGYRATIAARHAGVGLLFYDCQTKRFIKE